VGKNQWLSCTGETGSVPSIWIRECTNWIVKGAGRSPHANRPTTGQRRSSRHPSRRSGFFCNQRDFWWHGRLKPARGGVRRRKRRQEGTVTGILVRVVSIAHVVQALVRACGQRLGKASQAHSFRVRGGGRGGRTARPSEYTATGEGGRDAFHSSHFFSCPRHDGEPRRDGSVGAVSGTGRVKGGRRNETDRRRLHFFRAALKG
jgi:hypothetical protein